MAVQRRFALIVVSDDYKDEKLTSLKAPRIDAKKLSRLLKNQKVVAGYNVRLLPNFKSYKIRTEIESFFRNAEKNDLLLLYFSGHGYKALDDGRFYLVAPDSKLELTSSMISGAFVNDQISKSRAVNKILILDCCYSGAFLNMTPRSAKTVDINQEFQLDPGTVILTSSTAMQYSFEGNILKKEGTTEPSGIYTDLLIKGIESEEADTNADGKISCLELNAYLKNKMREIGHPQTPQIKIEKDDVTLAYTKKKSKDQLPAGSDTLQLIRDPAKEVDYLFKLAEARYSEDKYDLCVEAYDQILKIDPHNEAALVKKALRLQDMRKFEECLKILDEALIITDRKSYIIYKKGHVLRHMGRHHDAYRIFESFTLESKIPAIFPSFLDKIFDRGNILMLEAKSIHRELNAIIYNPKKALSYWQEKLESEHIDIRVRRNKDIKYMSFEERFRISKKSKKYDMYPVTNMAYLLHKLNRDFEALRYLEAALSWYPDDVYALDTAKSILEHAKEQYDIIKSKTDGRSMADKSQLKSLIGHINRITNT